MVRGVRGSSTRTGTGQEYVRVSVCELADPICTQFHMWNLLLSVQDRGTGGGGQQKIGRESPPSAFPQPTPPQGPPSPPGVGQSAPFAGSYTLLLPVCFVLGEPFSSPPPLG